MVTIILHRLVEEVREACEVDITNDDVFMNARYAFVLFARRLICTFTYMYELLYVLLCVK